MSIVTRCTNGVCVCVLPMEQNDFRPLALRHRSLAAISTILIAAKVIALSVVALTPSTAQLSTITANRITQQTNAERTKAGLRPLTVNNALTKAAQGKAQDMLANDYFAHISPSGVTPWFWISKSGYTYQVAGENLAIDFIEAEDIVAAWLASPSHKANMLHTSYTETGVAAATGEFQGGTSTVVVHMFGLPTVSTSQTPTPSPTPAPAKKIPATAPATTTKPTSAPTPIPTPTPVPTTNSTPSPTALPTTAPVDTTPPANPRIATADPETTVQDAVVIELTGDPESILHILINNQERARIALPVTGTTAQTLDVSGLPDGEFTVRAYAADAARNNSGSSDTLTLTKDTTPPLLDATNGIFALLSPNTDEPELLLTIAQADTATIQLHYPNQPTITIRTDEPISVNPLIAATVVLQDPSGNNSPEYVVQLGPQYRHEIDTSFATPPARFSRGARLLSIAAFIVVLMLLSLAIIIRFSIQRPALIAHASLVLVLATLLLLW